MKRNIFLASAFTTLLLSACSSDEPCTPQTYESPINPYGLTLNEALQNAEMAFSQINGEDGTRSISRPIASVRTITKTDIPVSTRGGNTQLPDTLLYLVNYVGDSGYALLAADSRLFPIYAISDEGSLPASYLAKDGDLNFFMGNVMYDIESTLNDYVHTRIEQPSNPGTNWGIESQIKPLIDASYRIWHQGDPFNSSCFTPYGKRAYVGCAAVAVGMVMAYHEWPLSYNGVTYPWSAMKADSNHPTIPVFLRQLGDKENLNITYAIDGSGADRDSYVPALKNMGYAVPENLRSFADVPIQNTLIYGAAKAQQGGPVLVMANTTENGKKSLGHAWIIDGFIKYKSLIQGGPIYNSSGRTLYHCVWGWTEGKSNGYFYYNDGVMGGDPTSFADDDTKVTGNQYTFDNSFNILRNFYPNK